jgi:hypothetical protein
MPIPLVIADSLASLALGSMEAIVKLRGSRIEGLEIVETYGDGDSAVNKHDVHQSLNCIKPCIFLGMADEAKIVEMIHESRPTNPKEFHGFA